MKKTILSLITLMLAVMLALTSCEGLFGPTGDGTGTGDQQQPGDNNKPADSGKFAQIVYPYGYDIMAFHSAIRDDYEMIPAVNDFGDPLTREIVIGETSRVITQTAISRLDAYLDSKSDYDIGYIAYYDGKSVALFWNDSLLEEDAVNDFLNTCVKEDKLVLEVGDVICKGFNKKEYKQESLWLKIANDPECSEELYQTLRSLNSFYEGSQICAWMANLWDPEVGGFYYANSSRDNEPYLPDLESTNQLTDWLQTNGACAGYGGSVNKMLPNEMKIKIVDFAKNMQHPSGYFFHPQWPQGTDKLNTDRYGRDLSWGVNIINRFTVDRDGDGVEEKQYPNYCTPSGAKCKEHYGTEQTCNLAPSTSLTSSTLSTINATSSVSSSVSAAVSKLSSSTVTAVVSSRPDYSSSAAFTAWLEEYNATIKENSGNAHNLNALQSEIIAKGFCDELVDHLERKQEESYQEQLKAGETPTGLWQQTLNMRFVWGILKYMPFYNQSAKNGGRLIQHAEEIIESCVKVIMLPADGGYAMNDLMNQTSSISSIISNIEKFDPDNANKRISAIQSRMKEQGADLIKSCMEKLRPFKLENGTFVYTYGGTAPAKIYGVPISLGKREADVNGNSLCSSYYRGMFGLFGYTAIPLCNEDDGEMFLEIVNSAEPINKIPEPKADFFDFESAVDTTQVAGLSYTKYTSGFDCSIEVEDDGEHGNVLYFKSGSDHASYGDYMSFSTNGNRGNCNIFEFDFKLISTSAVEMFQVKCGDSFMFHLDLDSSKNYLKITAKTGTSTSLTEVMLDPSKDKYDAYDWNKIRFEMYAPEDDLDHAVIKLFVNDDYIASTTLFFGSHNASATYNSNFASISFCSRMKRDTENYFDNVFARREDKPYDAENHDTSDSRDN